MDKEKINGTELNTPENDTLGDATPMTADELIKRLKSNLKQNPNLQGEDVFENDKAEEVSLPESEESLEEAEPEVEDLKKILTLEEAAELVQPEKTDLMFFHAFWNVVRNQEPMFEKVFVTLL